MRYFAVLPGDAVHFNSYTRNIYQQSNSLRQ